MDQKTIEILHWLVFLFLFFSSKASFQKDYVCCWVMFEFEPVCCMLFVFVS